MDEHSPALSPVPASITRSQAQVLRYLPEQVPFSIIADKLTHLPVRGQGASRGPYQRLGVHNRDEAVGRARTRGLLCR
jgi:hypothetical protein